MNVHFDFFVGHVNIIIIVISSPFKMDDRRRSFDNNKTDNLRTENENTENINEWTFYLVGQSNHTA